MKNACVIPLSQLCGYFCHLLAARCAMGCRKHGQVKTSSFVNRKSLPTVLYTGAPCRLRVIELYTASQKVPTFKLSDVLSNLNRVWKWNLLQNAYDSAHLTLDMLLHYLGKLKIQIFCRYSAHMEEKCKQIEFWVHRWIPVSRDISRTVLWSAACTLDSRLNH